jgi:hypothetical protein
MKPSTTYLQIDASWGLKGVIFTSFGCSIIKRYIHRKLLNSSNVANLVPLIIRGPISNRSNDCQSGWSALMLSTLSNDGLHMVWQSLHDAPAFYTIEDANWLYHCTVMDLVLTGFSKYVSDTFRGARNEQC